MCAVESTLVPGMTQLTGYIYDGSGARIAKGTLSTFSFDLSQNGFQPTEQYILGPSGEELTMLDGSGNWQMTNIYGGGALLATMDQMPNPAYPGTQGAPQMIPALHYHMTDPLGTRRVKADTQGVPEEDCQNLPFGDGLNCFADPNGNGDADNSPPLHFTGKERDAETGEANGNDYFGARYFASGLGRFMTPDWSAKYDPVPYAKLDNPQTLNLYAYVQNNPLTMRDPDGHQGGVDFGLPPSKPWDGWWSGADTMDGRNCALNPEDCDAGQLGYSDSGEQDAENRHASIIGKDFDPLGFAHDTVQWSWSGGSGTRDDNDRKYVAEAVGLAWAKMQEGGASADMTKSAIQYIYNNLTLYGMGAGQTPKSQYDEFGKVGLHGGNWNFNTQIGSLNITQMGFKSTGNGRNGVMPSVHIERDHFHVDTANGSSIAGPIHWIWDVLLGTYYPPFHDNGIPR